MSDEIDELSQKEPSAAASAFLEQAKLLAVAIIASVRHNNENLTYAGLESAVANRIAEFAAKHAPRPEKPPTRFTNKRPTKPGWYWIKTSSPTPIIVHVERLSRGAGLHANNLGAVNEIVGIKWCGPIEEPS